MFNMTRAEALAAMREGKRIVHEYFTPNEYLGLVGGVITTEDGYYFGDMFYSNEFMATGWAIWGEDA